MVRWCVGKFFTALGAGVKGFWGREGLEGSGVCLLSGLGTGVAAETLLDEATM